MSADSTVVYYGVRFEVSDDEVVALENRSHEKIIVARRYGLKYYWGNFAAPNSKYLLFIGDELGIIGLENRRQIHFRAEDLAKRMKETETKLSRAGIAELPALYLEWQTDA
jgi:hypothetical protein